MLAAVLLAATLPLGVWPADSGPAATVVDDVELYLVEPEDDYYVIAVEQLAAPLVKADEKSLKRLTSLAHRLGADGVMLLSGLDERNIPKDLDEPLPQGARYVMAVFVVFDASSDEEQPPALTRLRLARSHHPRPHSRHASSKSPPL
jgi:hypothetical protein